MIHIRWCFRKRAENEVDSFERVKNTFTECSAGNKWATYGHKKRWNEEIITKCLITNRQRSRKRINKRRISGEIIRWRRHRLPSADFRAPCMHPWISMIHINFESSLRRTAKKKAPIGDRKWARFWNIAIRRRVSGDCNELLGGEKEKKNKKSQIQEALGDWQSTKRDT
jgi:hypothetical protein